MATWKPEAVQDDAYIIVDEEVMGGTPVIRDTRITVYAIHGRIEHGDTIDDILADYPYITREAVEAGIHYAERNPFTEVPGGRPWACGR